MELKDTIDGMISNDYRERFKAEYRQTKERYERLKGFCNRIEAAERTGREEPRHDCPLELLREQQKRTALHRFQIHSHAFLLLPLELLREQQKRMGMYLETMEIRAAIEQIDLNK